MSEITDFDPEVVNLTTDGEHHVAFQEGMFLVKLQPDFLRLYLSEYWSPSGVSQSLIYGEDDLMDENIQKLVNGFLCLQKNLVTYGFAPETKEEERAYQTLQKDDALR